jgi:uracil-DNA glycosylase
VSGDTQPDMSTDAQREELRALVEEVGEQLEYFRELGVLGVEFAGPRVGEPGDAVPLTSSSRATPPAAARVVAPRSDALRRNAEAEARPHAAVESRPAPSQTQPGAASQFVARSEPDSESRPGPFEPSPGKDSAEMPKRKQVRTPDPVPPAPRETLFGEIAPQDELSLGRPGETLEDIREDVGLCMRCPLCCEGRTKIVHSEGNPKARLMFVGEAPGADEDAQGRPFVGRAGQLLNKIIEAIGLKREDVFIGNVNRCRPQNNRTPTSAEAAVCKPFLLREIAIVKPEVIVVLGNTAMHNLLDTKVGITKVRGTFQDYKGIKVMPTFHPAYLLRDPSKKRETWEDMKKVRDYLGKKNAGDE